MRAATQMALATLLVLASASEVMAQSRNRAQRGAAPSAQYQQRTPARNPPCYRSRPRRRAGSTARAGSTEAVERLIPGGKRQHDGAHEGTPRRLFGLKCGTRRGRRTANAGAGLLRGDPPGQAPTRSQSRTRSGMSAAPVVAFIVLVVRRRPRTVRARTVVDAHDIARDEPGGGSRGGTGRVNSGRLRAAGPQDRERGRTQETQAFAI